MISIEVDGVHLPAPLAGHPALEFCNTWAGWNSPPGAGGDYLTSYDVLLTFAASGALAGLAGVVYLAIYATGDSHVGSGYELQAVAAAVVGGVAIVGGSGTVWGVALGAFFLATISSALPVLGIPSLWQQAVVGIFIVVAITLDRVLAIRRTRAAIAQRNLG